MVKDVLVVGNALNQDAFLLCHSAVAALPPSLILPLMQRLLCRIRSNKQKKLHNHDSIIIWSSSAGHSKILRKRSASYIGDVKTRDVRDAFTFFLLVRNEILPDCSALCAAPCFLSYLGFLSAFTIWFGSKYRLIPRPHIDFSRVLRFQCDALKPCVFLDWILAIVIFYLWGFFACL